jgi:uncharacterized damage-inducible protein DinB
MKSFFSLLFSLCVCSGIAQNSLNDALKQQMIKEWERAKLYTQEYLDAMPADKYGFRAVDSIRSFSEQMLHLAHANAVLTSIATGATFPYTRQNFEKSPSAQSKDSVAYYVNTSYDFVIKAIKNLDFNKLGELVTFDLPRGRRNETRLAWLLKTFEHQTHHRGQTTIYIRLLGIRPPAEKLFDTKM